MQAEMHNQWQQSSQFAYAEQQFRGKACNAGSSRTIAQSSDCLVESRNKESIKQRGTEVKVAKKASIHRGNGSLHTSVLTSEDIASSTSAVNIVNTLPTRSLEASACSGAGEQDREGQVLLAENRRVEQARLFKLEVQTSSASNAKQQSGQVCPATPSVSTSGQGPHPSTQSIAKIQYRNREHPGLRREASDIKNVQLGMNDHHSVSMDNPSPETCLEFDSLGAHGPINLMLSAATDGPATTSDLRIALEKIRANEMSKQVAHGVLKTVSYPRTPAIRDKEEDLLWRESIFDVLRHQRKRSHDPAPSLRSADVASANISNGHLVTDVVSTPLQRLEVSQRASELQSSVKARKAVKTSLHPAPRPMPKVERFPTIDGFVPITRPVMLSRVLLATKSWIQPPPQAPRQTLEFSDPREVNDILRQQAKVTAAQSHAQHKEMNVIAAPAKRKTQTATPLPALQATIPRPAHTISLSDGPQPAVTQYSSLFNKPAITTISPYND